MIEQEQKQIIMIVDDALIMTTRNRNERLRRCAVLPPFIAFFLQ
jgi:hypothetical protein